MGSKDHVIQKSQTLKEHTIPQQDEATYLLISLIIPLQYVLNIVV